MRPAGVCLSVRLSVPSIDNRSPAVNQYLPAPDSSSGQRYTLRSEGQGSTERLIFLGNTAKLLLAEKSANVPKAFRDRGLCRPVTTAEFIDIAINDGRDR